MQGVSHTLSGNIVRVGIRIECWEKRDDGHVMDILSFSAAITVKYPLRVTRGCKNTVVRRRICVVGQCTVEEGEKERAVSQQGSSYRFYLYKTL